MPLTIAEADTNGTQTTHSLKFAGTAAQLEALQAIESQFEVPTDQLKRIMEHFIQEMEKGLDHHGATVAMIPSFVTGRPTGKETGKYLALDLGGTNLRVCVFQLLGDGAFTVEQQKFVLTDSLKTGPMRDLCDFIAECLDGFIAEHNLAPEDQAMLQLGFTFSFPVLQTEINRGVLKNWTKGFSCPGAVGKDTALMLQDALNRKNIPVYVAAIVNDTVGTLMAHAYRFPETAMGVILGTGSNASYYERISNIKKWPNGLTDSDEMVINMEWGAFDNERRVLPLTRYDNRLNRKSINVDEQLFEKMLSGMYLGEIARNVMVDLIDRRLLFDGNSSPEFNKQWHFETAYLSTIEGDTTSDLQVTKDVLEGLLGLRNTSLADRQMVKRISHVVARRAARLAGCAIGAVLSKGNHLEKKSIVAIDGSLFEFYPGFEGNMRQGLCDLLGAEKEANIEFALARDGSGLGAAIIAMVAHTKSLSTL